MAVVINGSGTVTGLAVGGLPDGTVDAGTLADNDKMYTWNEETTSWVEVNVN